MAEDALIWGRFLSPLLNSFSDSRKQGERGGGDLRSESHLDLNCCSTHFLIRALCNGIAEA